MNRYELRIRAAALSVEAELTRSTMHSFRGDWVPTNERERIRAKYEGDTRDAFWASRQILERRELAWRAFDAEHV